MQLEYMASPTKDVFIRADLGLMEDVQYRKQALYRPIKKKAFGLSLHIRQRV